MGAVPGGLAATYCLAVTVALITFAVVNTITITWTTAIEARPTMAMARTLGATPGQITAGSAGDAAMSPACSQRRA